ncbi:hypothetical protein SESBI_44863 [Sesbania bispinosa]|nr:hypothetical protein SESBI_44863 [Sesbania bispinosa]
MAYNPLIFQSLTDITWQGYQAASTPYSTQQKIYSITEGKSGGNSSHQDDEKKSASRKSSTNEPTTLVFDNSSNNLGFAYSSMNGNWPSRSITSSSLLIGEVARRLRRAQRDCKGKRFAGVDFIFPVLETAAPWRRRRAGDRLAHGRFHEG